MADLVQRDIQLPSAGMPDFTGASRGIDTNRAFEKLFSGIGDNISTFTKMKDSDIRNNIDKDARSVFNGTQDQAIEAAGGNPQGEPPQGLLDAKDKLGRMQAAYDQGLINDTHYYGRLTAELKAMRAKYPGYEDVVDTTIQEVTGTRPANSYRNALVDAINKEAADAEASGTRWDSYVKQNEEFIFQIAPDYFQNPEKYDATDIQMRVAKLKAQDQQLRSDNLMLDNMSKQDNLNEDTAQEVITKNFTQTTQREIETLNKTIGLDKVMTRMQNGDSPSAEEFGTLVSNFQAYKTRVKAKLLEQAAKPLSEDSTNNYYSLGGGTKAVNDIIDQAMAPFDVIEQYIGAKDWNMAAYHSKLIEYRGNDDLNTVIQTSLELRAGSALSKVAPELGSLYLQENQTKIMEGVEGVVPEIASGIALGQDTLGGATTRIANARNATDTSKSKAVQSTIDLTLKTITSGKGTPEQQLNAVKAAYDPKSSDALFKLVKPNEYQKLYAKMYNPEVTKAIMASGNAEVKKLYATSAMDRLQAIPEVRRMAADFQEGVEYAKYVKVAYDEKANRLVVTMDTPESPKNMMGSVAQYTNSKAVQRLIAGKDALNTAFATLGPIIEAGGGDETAAIQAVLKELAVDLGGEKKDSLIWQLYQKSIDATSIKQQQDSIDASKKAIGSAVDSISEGTRSAIDELSKPIGSLDGVAVGEIGDTKTDTVDTSNESFLDSYKFPKAAVEKAVTDGLGQFGKPVGDLMNKADTGMKPMNFVGAQPRGLEKLVSSNKRGYTPDLDNLRPRFKSNLVALQSEFGDQLKLVSGYRGRARNAKAGGAKGSQHIHGNAVDIDVSDWNKEKRIRFIQAARAKGFSGIGVYPNSIHVDMGKRRSWGPDHHNTSLPKWAKPYL